MFGCDMIELTSNYLKFCQAKRVTQKEEEGKNRVSIFVKANKKEGREIWKGKLGVCHFECSRPNCNPNERKEGAKR